MFGADTAGLPHTCSPALIQDCVFRGVIMVFLILSVYSGNDSLDVRFPSMIRFSVTAAVWVVMDAETGEGGHGGQLQNWLSCVEMAVGCGFTACKYLIVRTICLNKALFYVLLTCLFIVMVTFIYILLICSCFLLLSVNKIYCFINICVVMHSYGI